MDALDHARALGRGGRALLSHHGLASPRVALARACPLRRSLAEPAWSPRRRLARRHGVLRSAAPLARLHVRELQLDSLAGDVAAHHCACRVLWTLPGGGGERDRV